MIYTQYGGGKLADGGCECCGSTLGGSRHELVVMNYD